MSVRWICTTLNVAATWDTDVAPDIQEDAWTLTRGNYAVPLSLGQWWYSFLEAHSWQRPYYRGLSAFHLGYSNRRTTLCLWSSKRRPMVLPLRVPRHLPCRLSQCQRPPWLQRPLLVR